MLILLVAGCADPAAVQESEAETSPETPPTFTHYEQGSQQSWIGGVGAWELRVNASDWEPSSQIWSLQIVVDTENNPNGTVAHLLWELDGELQHHSSFTTGPEASRGFYLATACPPIHTRFIIIVATGEPGNVTIGTTGLPTKTTPTLTGPATMSYHDYLFATQISHNFNASQSTSQTGEKLQLSAQHGPFVIASLVQSGGAVIQATRWDFSVLSFETSGVHPVLGGPHWFVAENGTGSIGYRNDAIGGRPFIRATAIGAPIAFEQLLGNMAVGSNNAPESILPNFCPQ